jgi:quercetin dioxygenase-like cupin family protein
MKTWAITSFISLIFVLGFTSVSMEQGVTRPQQVMSKIVTGMPTNAEQEVRVFTAAFKPGDKTVFHKHRFPVTVFILEGAFSLELEGEKKPLVIKAGESYVEPPNRKMTGYNHSTTAPLKLVIFYVSDKGTPFLDMIDPMTDMPPAKP